MISPYNPKLGQTIRSHAKGVYPDRGFIAHYILPAAGAIAADDDYLVTAKVTTGAAQNLAAANFANILATPKVLNVTSVTVGQTGNVIVTGTDMGGNALTEAIAINGNGAQAGAKVFATVAGIQYPAAVYQTGTFEVLTAAVTQAGNVTMTVTAAAIGGAKTVVVALAATDTVEEVATKIAAGIAGDAAIGAGFGATADGAVVTITAKAFAADDATYNVTLADTGGTGATIDAFVDGAAGSPTGNLKVGVLGSFGIPYKLPHDTVLKAYNGATVTTVAAGSHFSATDVRENYIQLTDALAGAEVHVYMVV